MPAPILPPRSPLYARTPPALFPLCLGFVGLALAWRRVSDALGFHAGVGETLLSMSAVLFAATLLLYLRKLAARPIALLDDLRTPAGRGALSAGSMTMMLLGFGFVDIAEGLARALWLSGLVAHLVLAALLIELMLHLPRGTRPATPALYVPFVGQIVAPMGGVPLGYEALSAGILVVSIIIWIGLTGPILARLSKAAPQPPVRPPLAILLAPPAIGLVAHHALPPALQSTGLELILFVIASLTAVFLLIRATWLTEGGFTPLWASFTFPFAAYAGAAGVMVENRMGAAWDAVAAGALAAATLITFFVTWRFVVAAKAGELFRAPVI